MLPSDSSSPSPSPASSPGSLTTSPGEPAVISALRILVAGGGVAFLVKTTQVPSWAALVAFVIIAIPTHAGAVIDVVGRLVPNVGRKG